MRTDNRAELADAINRLRELNKILSALVGERDAPNATISAIQFLVVEIENGISDVEMNLPPLPAPG